MNIPLMPWDGSKPAVQGTLVVIQYRNGDTNCGVSNEFNWAHANSFNGQNAGNDIVAYQVMGAQVKAQAIAERSEVMRPAIDLLGLVHPIIRDIPTDQMTRRERNVHDSIVLAVEDLLEQEGRTV